MSDHSSPDSSELHPHVLPLKVYFGVWAALLVFTVVTVAVSYFDFGEANIVIALVIAMFKAGLVATFFMHLKYDDKLNGVVFGSSLIFVFIFFFLTFGDTRTRGLVDKWQGTFVNAHAEKASPHEAANAAVPAAGEAATTAGAASKGGYAGEGDKKEVTTGAAAPTNTSPAGDPTRGGGAQIKEPMVVEPQAAPKPSEPRPTDQQRAHSPDKTPSNSELPKH
jgi:cytochrome c oxidase subunit 4